mmetsp:Transcript_35046/g.82548  ORF Transcript_35046/g.82548 Transcript_35046/m.82548 type:complete len:200 (+) Transcript_35046:184-783(+)
MKSPVACSESPVTWSLWSLKTLSDCPEETLHMRVVLSAEDEKHRSCVLWNITRFTRPAWPTIGRDWVEARSISRTLLSAHPIMSMFPFFGCTSSAHASVPFGVGYVATSRNCCSTASVARFGEMSRFFRPLESSVDFSVILSFIASVIPPPPPSTSMRSPPAAAAGAAAARLTASCMFATASSRSLISFAITLQAASCW